VRNLKKTKDLYEVLGVDRKATKEEIKKAYKKKAKAYHPDVNKSPEAEERFKEAQEAYEVLHDDDSRTSYDQYGERWREGANGYGTESGNFGNARSSTYGGGFGTRGAEQGGTYGGTRYQTGDADYSDLFSQFFGGAGVSGGQAGSYFSQEDLFNQADGAREQADEEATLHLTLEEIVRGGKVNVHVREKKLSISIPASVIDGQQLRLKGMGNPYGNGNKGDLYVTIKIKPDPVFTVDAYNLTANLEIAPWHAALGTEAKLGLRGGSTINVKVPAMGANGGTGHKLRLTGKGLRKPDGSFGDLFVVVDIKVPPAKTEKEQQLYRELAKLRPLEPVFTGA
jgi:curved DNA-binding protein